MPKFIRSAFQDTQSQAIERLVKIVEPRKAATAVNEKSDLEIEPRELLINAPAVTLKPIIRMSLLALIIVGVLWWLSKPSEVTAVQKITSENISASQNSSADLGKVVVHVTGDVVNPGVVSLPAGSRVTDAIDLAGGLIPGVTESGLNLAAVVEDGQLIAVGGAQQTATDNRINLNTATLAELDTLPGVGPVMAQRILAWRELNTSFSNVSELQEVEGIGPKLFSRIKDLVRI